MYTTRDLANRLIKSIHEDSIAERNSIARAASSLIATKQLEVNVGGRATHPVDLGNAHQPG